MAPGDFFAGLSPPLIHWSLVVEAVIPSHIYAWTLEPQEREVETQKSVADIACKDMEIGLNGRDIPYSAPFLPFKVNIREYVQFHDSTSMIFAGLNALFS
jgi:hypothetical protein